MTLRIIIENGQEGVGQNSTPTTATFFDPCKSAATNAGPAPPTSLGISTTAMSRTTELADVIPGAKALDAGPPSKSLLELIKSATTRMSISTAYEKDKGNDIDAGEAPKL